MATAGALVAFSLRNWYGRFVDRGKRWHIDGIDPPRRGDDATELDARVSSLPIGQPAGAPGIPVTPLPGVTHILTALAVDDAGSLTVGAQAFDVVKRNRVVERVLIGALSRYVVYECPLATPGWHVAARFFLEDNGELVLAEVQIFPDAHRSRPLTKPSDSTTLTNSTVDSPISDDQLFANGWILAGRWAQIRSESAPSPLGIRDRSMTSNVVRSVSLSDLETRAASWVHRVTDVLHSVGLTGSLPLPDRATRRPGRRGRPDWHYAMWAARYVETEGSLVKMAEKYGETREHVRDQVHEARVRGLLTGGGNQRRRGGSLTPEGERALRDLIDSQQQE